MPVYYDVPMHGQRNIKKCKEQIQQDLVTYLDGDPNNADSVPEILDRVYQIITQNFKSLEK